LEDAQQAFESAPFIEEHLTLARELASQDRLEEAEAECKKVFALDPTNPDGHVLLMELRTRRAHEARPQHAAPHHDPAASGRPMRRDRSQLKGIPRPSAEARPPAEPSPEPAAESAQTAETLPDDLFDFDPSSLDAAAPAARADAVPVAAAEDDD